MTRLILTASMLIALCLPAAAAAGQASKPDRSQPVRKADYWLSRDMQRLVFWQAPDRESRAADPSAR